MKSDTPLDYAVFQLSPRHSRCELFVSSDGSMEKIASGSIQPFAAHLKVVEEQVALTVNSIKLEVERHKNAETWFTKGTVERFVRFVSTPDVLESVNTFDAEMSQLEAARKLYSQGTGGQISGLSDGKGASSAADATKKELLKAIDVRLAAVSQDLTMACAHASAAGFDPYTIPELQLFAQSFGAHCLNEACMKFVSVQKRRPNLFCDMSIAKQDQSGAPQAQNKHSTTTCSSNPSQTQSNTPTCQQPITFPPQHNSTTRTTPKEAKDTTNNNNKNKEQASSSNSGFSQPGARRLSVQDRINLFESKQKESKPVNVAELRRLSSDTTSTSSVLRRWSDITIHSTKDSNHHIDKRDDVGSVKSVESNEQGGSLDEQEIGQLNAPSFPKDSSVVNVGEARSIEGQDRDISRSNLKSHPTEVQVTQEESSSKLGDSEVPEMKLRKPLAVPLNNTHVYDVKPTNPVKIISDNEESNDDMVSTAQLEQVQRVRQSKGNQQLNDDLKIKASQLEILFAEHKLRGGPSDHASSSRRDNPQKDNLHNRKSDVVEVPQKQYEDDILFTPPGNMLKFSSTDSKIPKEAKIDYSETLRNNFPRKGFSDDSKGKYYDKYMQKRNAKLSDEWSTSKRAEKEARLKAMQDTLEQSRAEMKAKLSGSVYRQGSESGSHSGRRSFNTLSFQRTEQSEEDEPSTQLDRFSGDTALRSDQLKKASAKKSRAAPIPRSSPASNFNFGKRRMQSGNSLAQSVPNYPDFRKENTKPSFGARRTMARTSVRTHARTKSSTEDEAQLNEVEKPKKSQSLRKNYAGPLKDISDSSYDGDVLEPLKASISDERLNDGDEPDDATFEEEEEEPEAIQKEYSCTVYDGNSTRGADSGKLDYSESEIGNPLTSQVDPTAVHELAPPVSVESLYNSPGESPYSWKSRTHDRFPYLQETSDIDASADSPGESPAYWNSHLLSQTEDDVAGLRKSWGSAHKTAIVSSPSQSHSHKDVTKGFKRLLKFGRKNRGTDNLADWVSVTTSEGDDDTEDGRDPATRSSEDFRKSRMGFSQGQSSDDGFIESELLIDRVQASRSSIPAPPANFKLRDEHASGSSIKAPRSFFSLSTFRSKGSDPKAR